MTFRVLSSCLRLFLAVLILFAAVPLVTIGLAIAAILTWMLAISQKLYPSNN